MLLSSDWSKITFTSRIWSVVELWRGQRLVSLEKKMRNVVFERITNVWSTCDPCVTHMWPIYNASHDSSWSIWDPWVTMWPICNSTQRPICNSSIIHPVTAVCNSYVIHLRFIVNLSETHLWSNCDPSRDSSVIQL